MGTIDIEALVIDELKKHGFTELTRGSGVFVHTKGPEDRPVSLVIRTRRVPDDGPAQQPYPIGGKPDHEHVEVFQTPQTHEYRGPIDGQCPPLPSHTQLRIEEQVLHDVMEDQRHPKKVARDWDAGGFGSPLYQFTRDFLGEHLALTPTMAAKAAELFMERWCRNRTPVRPSRHGLDPTWPRPTVSDRGRLVSP